MNTAPSHDSSQDPLLASLARLPSATPDPAHDARVRQRCHAMLAERRRDSSARARHLVSRPLETFLVGAFGLVYLVAILYDAALVYR